MDRPEIISENTHMSTYPVGFPELFWSRVNKRRKDDCWEWTGTRRNPQGYGQIGYSKRYEMVHRIAYKLAVGPIPKGWLVCHHCDNPPCCNPKHLFAGTHLDNNRDRERKGRGADHSGENNGIHVLVWKDVRRIRKLVSNGHSRQLLAIHYRVSIGTIHHIIRAVSWIDPSYTPPAVIPRIFRSAKLTESEVTQMRQHHAKNGSNFVELGRKFGVNENTAALVIKRRTWKHVP